MTIAVDHSVTRLATVESSLTADEFKAAFRHHPGGVALITAVGPDGPVALTATSVTSVSADPPLLVFSVSELSSSYSTIVGADTVVVHLLGAKDRALAKLGATSGIDRFADTSLWDRLITGEPYFPAVRTWIRGRVIDRMRAGSSTVVAVHALQARLPESEAAESAAPLVYYRRTWHELTDQSEIGRQ